MNTVLPNEPERIAETKPSTTVGARFSIQKGTMGAKWLLYAKFTGVSVGAGQPVFWTGTTGTEVSNVSGDIVANTLGSGNRPAGIAMTTLTTGQYGVFQTDGPCYVVSDGTIVKGNSIQCTAGYFTRFAPGTAGNDHLFAGSALADDSPTTGLCLVDLNLTGRRLS